MPIRNAGEECLAVEELFQQQLERLQSTLNRAFRSVPFDASTETEETSAGAPRPFNIA